MALISSTLVFVEVVVYTPLLLVPTALTYYLTLFRTRCNVLYADRADSCGAPSPIKEAGSAGTTEAVSAKARVYHAHADCGLVARVSGAHVCCGYQAGPAVLDDLCVHQTSPFSRLIRILKSEHTRALTSAHPSAAFIPVAVSSTTSPSTSESSASD